jgi:hypothetical protein
MYHMPFGTRAFPRVSERAQVNPKPVVPLCNEGIADALLLLCLAGMGIDRADVRWVPWLLRVM